MTDESDSSVWVGNYLKHRQATVGDWNSSRATARTGEYRAHSQYNPLIYGSDDAIRSLEMTCLKEGTSICRRANRSTHYMRVEGTIIGACSGEQTEYVFVENTSGQVHGRPISKAELKKRGVAI